MEPRRFQWNQEDLQRSQEDNNEASKMMARMGFRIFC